MANNISLFFKIKKLLTSHFESLGISESKCPSKQIFLPKKSPASSKAHLKNIYICILKHIYYKYVFFTEGVMKKIELEIIALSHSITQTHSYAVVLGEVGGYRRLPIVIGGFEAQAIAVALEKMSPSRPLTHDLMKNFLLAFSIDLHEIIISDLQEGIFFSKLICSSDKETIEIDSRTSDAIALAVRFGCPIYTYDNIMDSAGIVMEETEQAVNKETESEFNVPQSSTTSPDKNLKTLSLEELNILLNEVLESEDYMKAIAIRDEINSRKK